jgi:transposase
VLTATQWAKMEPYCLGNPTDPRRSGRNRLLVEAVPWIVRTGAPGRDRPGVFGKWNTVFQMLPGLGESQCLPGMLG